VAAWWKDAVRAADGSWRAGGRSGIDGSDAMVLEWRRDGVATFGERRGEVVVSS